MFCIVVVAVSKRKSNCIRMAKQMSQIVAAYRKEVIAIYLTLFFFVNPLQFDLLILLLAPSLFTSS
jgi:hypothetical protein